MPQAELALTGERTLPGIASENYWFRRHEAAYTHLRDRLAGSTLLEIGAGEGYGAARLAERFELTCALDYDAAATGHLAARYPRLRACRANLAALPIRTGTIDAAVSLQVLEHVWFCEQFLAECRRVLRPAGVLALSTPNRLTFSPGLGRGAKPANPFHVREFDAEELVGVLARAGFEVTALLGLHAGSRLQQLDERFGGFVLAQLASPPARWSGELSRAVAGVGVGDFELRDDRLDDSLDLIALARPGGGPA